MRGRLLRRYAKFPLNAHKEAGTGSVERAIEIHVSNGSKGLVETSSERQGNGALQMKSPPPLSSVPHRRAVGNTDCKPPASASPTTTLQKRQRQQKLASFFSPKSTSSASGANKSSAVEGALKRKHTFDSTVEAKKSNSEGDNLRSPSAVIDLIASSSKPAARIRSVSASRGTVTTHHPTSSSCDEHKTGKEQIPYSFLADKFSETSTTKRNEKLRALKELFGHVIAFCGKRQADASDASRVEEGSRILLCVLELTLGRIGIQSNQCSARRLPIPLQVSGASASKAIQTVTGTSRNDVRTAYRKKGDLGDVAAGLFLPTSHRAFFNIKASSPLSTQQVHSMLTAIATVPQGGGSHASRQSIVMNLLRACKHKEEMRFIVRTLLGNMRLGATVKTALAGVALAFDEVEPETSPNASCSKSSDAVQRLQKLFHICPRLDEISSALLKGGIGYAEEVCSLSIGFPVEPMLANPAQSMDQVEKFMQGEEAVAEWKYDGVRCQAHWDGANMALFSRHMLEYTDQYPDAVQYILNSRKLTATNFIIDAEIVAVMPSGDSNSSYRLLPFQDLSTRRATKIESPAERVQIRVYIFDLMLLNGESLLTSAYHRRQVCFMKASQSLRVLLSPSQ